MNRLGRPDRPSFVRAIVVGVFPPEEAPALRVEAAEAARIAEPKIRARVLEAQRLYVDSLLYGNAYAIVEPKGLIRGTSPINAFRAGRSGDSTR